MEDNLMSDTHTKRLSSWSAIARGAALRGLEGLKVPFKKCRYHYGTTYSRPFDPVRDDKARDSIWKNDRTGEEMVSHCMDWHFARVRSFCSNILRRLLPFVFTTDSLPHSIERRTYSEHQQKDRLHPLVLPWQTQNL